MIILPDIHGRTFWKGAVAQKEANEKVIFLGDYLEPYSNYEPITHKDAYLNFLEILEYKKNHIDDCVLLLGNHDFACISDDMISCRHDYKNGKRNTKLFNDNMSLFRLIYVVKCGKKQTYMLSHAGVHYAWVDSVIDDFSNDPEDICKQINAYFDMPDNEKRKYERRCLNVVSKYRAGWMGGPFGSCIWADVREWEDKEVFPNTYQIFGHTQLSEGPIITDWFAELDCRCAFRLNTEKKCKNMKNRIEQITFENKDGKQ